jgi:hypothetical protein
MQKGRASGGVSFLRGGISTCRFFKYSWCFGVELLTFVVKGTRLCRLTAAVLESLSRLKRQAKRAQGVNISQRQPLGYQRGDRQA